MIAQLPFRAWLWLFVGSTLIAGAIVVARLATEPRRSSILQAFGLEQDRALLVWSVENREAPLVEVVDREGSVLWSRLMPGYQRSINGRSKVVLSGDTVIIQLQKTVANTGTNSLRTAWTRGLSLADGAPRWSDGPLPTLASDRGFQCIYSSLFTTNDQVYEFREEMERLGLVVARESRTGRELWRLERRSGVTAFGPVWLVGGILVVADLHSISYIDRDTGQVLRRQPILGTRPCVVGDRVITSREGELWLTSLPSLEERRLDLELELERYPSFQGPCGRLEDRLIFAVGEAVFALDWEALEVDWQLDIDVASFEHVVAGADVARSTPEALPFSGELTRFVPVLMFSRPTTLAMLDLREGELVWLAARDQLLHSHLLRNGTVHYLVFRGEGEVIAAYDGETGRMLSGRRFGAFHNGIERTKPHHFLGDSILLHAENEWLIVDGRTLSRVGGSADTEGVELSREQLGELGVVASERGGGGG